MEIHKHDKTALLFGATGMVGSHLLQFLLLDPAYQKIIAFTRRPLAFEHEKLEVHQIDFDQPDKWHQLVGGDDLFLCLGTTMAKAGSKEAFRKVDYEYNWNAAKMAHKNGANQLLLVSSVGASINSRFYYSQIKGELENAVQQLDFWATHIFRPSVLLGERNENRFGEKLAGKIGKVFDRFTGGLLSKYRPIEADIVAKAMIGAAQGLKKGAHIYPSHWLQKLAEEVDAGQ